jgi:hypothetical protein
MSWQSFKDNMKRVMDNPQSIGGIEDFAKTFADSYDNAVKQGGDLLNRVKIQRGNKDLLELYAKLALFKGVTTTTDGFNLINELGKGVEMYWTGATLQNNPVPLLPAPGSTKNLSVSLNQVTNAGSWPQMPVVIPSTKTETFLNVFILAATIHLLGVSGIVQTTSLYPPNGTPNVGMINWSIYLLKPPVLFKAPELEGTYNISQVSPTESCKGEEKVEGNTFPPRSSLGNLKAIDVSEYQGTLNDNNFWLSDGKGYREFKWVTYPRIAVPISNQVESCPTT